MSAMNPNEPFRHIAEFQRVVITGLGMVTPLGIGKEAFSERLFAGAGAISEISLFDTAAFSSHLAAEVKNFSPRDFISIKNLRRMDKLSLLTTAAARLALEDAGLVVDGANRDRTGIILGTSFGPTDVTAQLAEILIVKGPPFVNPSIVPNTVMNAPAGHASIEMGFRGVNTTVTQYAVSGETALAYAVTEIRRGSADYILAGGADILSPFCYEALTKLRALSPLDGGPEGCRPFDKAGNGAVAGEGCGLLCLESLASALRRGKQPYCEITGVGMGSSPTAPTDWPRDPTGATRTLRRTLANASLAAGDIQAISAAANGHGILDAMEADAYGDMFAGTEEGPLITSLKGAIGESFSGGGIRACALALSMEQGALPLTVGLSDPIRPLAFVRDRTKSMNIEHALLAGISFGGTYVYTIFSSCRCRQ
jgi:3-oxoacyl-[acyl-carrier-protein] synthase II